MDARSLYTNCLPVDKDKPFTRSVPVPRLQREDVPLYCRMKGIRFPSQQADHLLYITRIKDQSAIDKNEKQSIPPQSQEERKSKVSKTGHSSTPFSDVRPKESEASFLQCMIPLRHDGGVTGMEFKDKTEHQVIDYDQYSSQEVVSSILQAKDNIQDVKASLGLVNESMIHAARAATNPYETIGRSVFVNRASVKLAEIDHMTELTVRLLSNKKGSDELIFFVDMCTGQGGFSEYILYRAAELGMIDRVKGVGMTLKVKSEESEYDVNQLHSSSQASTQLKIFDGVDGTGDVCVNENIESFSQFVRTEITTMSKLNEEKSSSSSQGVGLVLSDGGKSVYGQEKLQELSNARLKLCEVIAMFHVLQKGGDFVLKVYDVYTPLMTSLLYLLYRHFDETAVIKPKTSRPANSERYLVCRGLKASQPINTIQYLMEVNKKMRDMNESSHGYNYVVAKQVIIDERKFRDYLRKVNLRHATLQDDALQKMLKYISEPDIVNTSAVTDSHRDLVSQLLEQLRLPTVRPQKLALDDSEADV